MTKPKGTFHIYINQYDIQSPWNITHMHNDGIGSTEYRFKNIYLNCKVESLDRYHVMPHKNRYTLQATNATLIIDGSGNGRLEETENENV